MKLIKSYFLITVVSSLVSIANAATIVEQRDAQGTIQRVTIDEKFARIDGIDNEHYTIVDLENKKLLSVDVPQKRVVEMSAASNQPLPAVESSPPQLDSKLSRQGEGPDIAGFSTLHYQITTGGKICSNDYISEDAGKIEFVERFVKVMHEIMTTRKRQMGKTFSTSSDPCRRVLDKLEEEYVSIGLPMKSIDMNNKVKFEVIDIKMDAQPADGMFLIPKDFKVVTEKEVRQTLQEEIRKKLEAATRKQLEGNRPTPLAPSFSDVKPADSTVPEAGAHLKSTNDSQPDAKTTEHVKPPAENSAVESNNPKTPSTVKHTDSDVEGPSKPVENKPEPSASPPPEEKSTPQPEPVPLSK